MLKPADQPASAPRPEDERPVSELVHELIEDGKAYARSEVSLVKAIAAAKANALKLPSILFATALLLLIAAVNVFAVGVFSALSDIIGPFAAGVLAFLIFAAAAGGLAWFGAKRLREDL